MKTCYFTINKLSKIYKVLLKNMLATAPTTPVPLDTVLDHIFAIRKITRHDQQLLMSTLLSKPGLNEQEQRQISRVFDGLQRGLIKVVE